MIRHSHCFIHLSEGAADSLTGPVQSKPSTKNPLSDYMSGAHQEFRQEVLKKVSRAGSIGVPAAGNKKLPTAGSIGVPTAESKKVPPAGGRREAAQNNMKVPVARGNKAPGEKSVKRSPVKKALGADYSADLMPRSVTDFRGGPVMASTETSSTLAGTDNNSTVGNTANNNLSVATTGGGEGLASPVSANVENQQALASLGINVTLDSPGNNSMEALSVHVSTDESTTASILAAGAPSASPFVTINESSPFVSVNDSSQLFSVNESSPWASVNESLPFLNVTSEWAMEISDNTANNNSENRNSSNETAATTLNGPVNNMTTSSSGGPKQELELLSVTAWPLTNLRHPKFHVHLLFQHHQLTDVAKIRLYTYSICIYMCLCVSMYSYICIFT